MLSHLRRLPMVAASRCIPKIPHHRHIFQYAASHPDETMILLSAALGMSMVRMVLLEVKTRAQDQALQLKEDTMTTREKSHKEIEKDLRVSIDTMLQKYNKLQNDKRRMEASIIDRGRAGEIVLSNLLEECKTQNIIKAYKLQHEIEPGKIPDSVVEIIDGIFIVVDSKAPNPPDELDKQSRKDYVDKLKGHIRQLSDKRYTATIEKQCPVMMTIMMLPGEGYLQVAYDKSKDVFGLHKFAIERNVLVLGPHGLRTLLQVVKIWSEGQAANDRLEDAQVHENIVTTLHPLWIESVLPLMKKSGRLLENVVTTWNSKVDTVIEFDKVLRSKEILDMAKARKTQLPKKVTLPKSIDDE